MAGAIECVSGVMRDLLVNNVDMSLLVVTKVIIDESLSL
jgi:hypothetical protein